MKNTGWAIHVHHKEMFEWCYDYEGRVKAIKDTKPKNEQGIRLRLLELLPEEAIAELPVKLVEACKVWDEAYKARDEANKARDEAYKAWDEADNARDEAYKARDEADKAWDEADREAWHDKWCGCKEWNGKEIVFE